MLDLLLEDELDGLVFLLPGHLAIPPQPRVRHLPHPLHVGGLEPELLTGHHQQGLQREAGDRQLQLEGIRVTPCLSSSS